MSAADHINKLDWPCPQCTVFNTYINERCTVCGYLNANNQKASSVNSYKNDLRKTSNQIKDLRLNNQQQEPKIDSNNNSNMFKTAFNTLSNDIKNFINGFSPNNSKNNSSSININNNNNNNNVNNSNIDNDVIYDYTDNPDVIEIDPSTNKPIRQIHSNYLKDDSTSKKTRRKLLPSTFTNPIQSSSRSDQWVCNKCTYAANPDWSLICEICNGDRSSNKNTNPQFNSNKEDVDPTGLIVYDNSLNEDIYDYARIWTCNKCTYINFKKDTECELCLTSRNPNPNSQNNKILNESNNNQTNKRNESKSKPSSFHQKENKWICKMCTYLNSNSTDQCSVCNTSSSLLENFKQRNKNYNNNLVIGGKEEWICQICSHRNKSSKTNCLVCLNSKEPKYYEITGLGEKNFQEIDNDDDDDDDDNNDAYYSNSIYNPNNSSRSATLNPSSTFRSQKAKSIIKTYTNATNQAERIWNNIVKYCKEQGHKFVDDSFPPCDKSLFIDPNKKPENLQLRGIQWLSPEYIRTHHDEYHLKWTVYNEPKFNDIKQGLLGNCWLLSGLAVIIEKPEMLRRIIITKDYCPQGCYQVRLCLNGEWQTVIVDDLFPCDSNGCLVYSQASRKQLWVPLIEKAMAKLNGNYESLIAGQTVEGLSTLTGYPCDSIRLEHSSSTNEDEIDLEMIWARLISMKDYGYSMGASCGRTDIKDDNVFTSKGLLPRHAYSVLNVKEINGNQLIQLRNPWGRYTWTGDWSDSSSKWTTEMKKICGVTSKTSKSSKYSNSSHNQNDNHFYNHSDHRNKSDQGVFWMSFNDFVQYFCSIDICKTRLDWYENRMSGYFNPEGTREMQAYHLVVFETSEIDIGLFHKTIKNRRENSDLDLCFVVLRTNGQRNSVGKFMFASKHSVRKFIGSENIFEPGEYIIVPFSFNFWYTSSSTSNRYITNEQLADANSVKSNKNEFNNLYNLVLHSPKVFFLEQEMHAAFLLADALIRFCVSKGSRTYSGLENACIYTLTKGFAGIVVVAENYNERAYLHVELDCEKSNNVVSTRQALITKDSVQPLHRQVLIVLTHLEGTTGYSIQYSIKYRLSSNPFLNTWPGNEGQMVTNVPVINKQTFGLHAPRSTFD